MFEKNRKVPGEPGIWESAQEEYKRLAAAKYPSLSEVVAGLLAAASAIVAMGAIVVWLRIGEAGLPQAEALSLYPREDLIVIGARALALPVLFWTGIQAVLIPFSGALGARTGYRAAHQAAAATGKSRDISTVRTFVINGLIGVAAGMLFFFPITYTMALAAITCLGLVLLVKMEVQPNLPMMLGVAALLSFANGVAKEADSPGALPRAVVTTTDEGVIRGTFITSGSNGVFLGVGGDITQVPARFVRQVRVMHVAESPTDPPDAVAERLLDLII